MPTRKKVCHLTSVHIPFDTRIFHRELKTLARAGYDVSYIARHNKAETIDGVRIIPLPAARNRAERMTLTAWRLYRLALREKADLYHFHDPELLPVGILLKLTTKAKVVYDVHEEYAKQMGDKYWIGGRLASSVARGMYIASEKAAMPLLDGIVAVTDFIADLYPPEKTVIVHNYVSLNMIDAIEPVKIDTPKPVLVYGGHLSANRGIREVISAMEHFGGRVRLWLLGKWDNPAFEQECRSLPGWKYTTYFGEKPVEEAFAYYKRGTIGLCYIYGTDFYLRGLNTKVFEYSACGIPTVVTYSPHWKDIFGEFSLFVDPKDPSSLLDAIGRLIDDPELRGRLGANARRFVESGYNWEKETETLLAFYDRLLGGK